ncbi:MAG: thiol reductant ABC exporter subunit CydD [Furfurilactobacillus sp.]|jgi:ATP-binding cassette subfamily C protein CydD|uniref:Thiol reductant ABC exporter subunit CydD n=1 Tax=Furfurilactobacillus milii TaxID=2888272 RepID=A0ABT6DA96_9LACO|nr:MULTISPECIES: thiol reductant ABC exporter subunit CydD [Furfurilactobacillus]QLE66098.1 Transport ATP-binding protein CydD [Furfurilactobacillus rossiae]MCF6160803.1 thiol reductant ABC exporter subunit CydD [Furfurilactobacillus milii]MCF6163003.1 thiol reductant ABC exporter subunit CydD [Furfurilactobacillus milii]MCF6419712.1 thiol reductant ABC exporter subunit CydD [Furfurilactobacillus milii]MCH4012616.1 thiol reductant ABC exporter subunit CydD [Furfurilactobacillus sp.]
MIDRRIFRLPGITKMLIVLAGLVLLQAFSILFQGVFLSRTLTDLWNREAETRILWPVLLFAGFFALRQILVMLKNRVMQPWADQTVFDLRQQLLQKLVAIGPSIVAKQGTGKVVTMALDGMNQVNTYLMLVVIKIFDMMIIPTVLLVYLFFLRWQEALFLLVIFPVIILFMIILGYAARDKANREFASYTQLSNNFVDALRGLPTLKQLGLSEAYADNIYAVSEDHRKRVMGTLTIAILSTFALDFFTTLSIAVVAVFLGLGLVAGHIALFPALTILILAPEYFLPIRNFANDYHATLNGKNALTAVLEVLNTPVPTDRNLLTDQQATWTSESQLRLEHVNFGYDKPDETALTDISFTANGYQKIGIIGPSGSGKSTLINLLGGFLTPNNQDAGRISINGVTVPHLSQQAWQRQFLYIPQAPYLFHATLADNIKFYTPDADDAAVSQAIASAGLTDWVATLPEGLQTEIGEGARGVSGGQAQRIALARAFLDQSRRILLFDEPTAHLDIETEVGLKETIKPVFANHLVFFATHRLHWLNEMDYLLVIEHGRVVEQGTPDALAKQNGAYTALRREMGGDAL